MRLAVVCQAVDPNDPVLGSFADWLQELAGRVERTTVLTLRAAAWPCPPNVEVRALRASRPWGRARELYQRLMACAPVDAVFAHMCPEYVIGSAPFAKPRQVPLVLWYAHGATPVSLRVASRLGALVVTSSADGFRLRARHAVIGQGINTDRFRPATAPVPGRRLLSVGRLSPVKGYERLLAAVARLVHTDGMKDVGLDIAGGPSRPADASYAESLRRLARALGIEDRVRWLGAVPHTAMPEVYARCAAYVSTSHAVSLERATLEAMACGKPVVTTNAAFRSLLGAPLLDHALVEALRMSDHDRDALGRQLRERVVEEHGLRQWGGRLQQVLAHVA